MTAYLWGLLTLPLIAFAGLVLIYLAATAARAGFSIDARWRSAPIPDHTRRDGVWFERQHGPVFVGGWSRDVLLFGNADKHVITKWVGIGRRPGPQLMVFRTKETAIEMDVMGDDT